MLSITCFILPIFLAISTAVVFVLPVVTPKRVSTESISTIGASHLGKVMVALVLLFASLSLFTVWGQTSGIPIIYWGVLHFHELFVTLIIFSAFGAIHLARPKHNDFPPFSSWGLLVACLLFWLAVLPLGMGSRAEEDSLTIEGRTYHLVSYTHDLEQHSGLELYQCDSSGIMCRYIVRSNPDRYTVKGELFFDSLTNTLQAEATSCFKYTAIAFCPKPPCALPDK